MGNYRLQGFGDTDPGEILTDAINQAEQRVGSAGWLVAGIFVAVALIVWGKK